MVNKKVRFNWREHPELEILEKRTHEEKHFGVLNSDKIVMIKSSGLLHAKTNEGFKDIQTELPDFNFPEGKDLNLAEDKHYMLELPSWGNAVVEENGKVVRVYDLDGVSIFKYHSPLITHDGELPYEIQDLNGVKIKDGLAKDLKFDQKLIRKTTAEDADFEVSDNKLYFKLKADTKIKTENKKTVKAWDDTDTSSTNNADTFVRQQTPTTNLGTNTVVTIYNASGLRYNAFFRFTMSAGSGSISDVKLYLYNVELGASLSADVQEMTTTDWVENQATYNIYKTGSNWTTSGGDFSATIIDTTAVTSTSAWYNWVLMGTGATNPLTLDWSDVINIALRVIAGDTSGSQYANFATKEYATSGFRPYLEITYTPGGFTPTPLMHMRLMAGGGV